MRVYSLAEFPPPPALGKVTLEESDGLVYSEKESPDVLRVFQADVVYITSK